MNWLHSICSCKKRSKISLVPFLSYCVLIFKVSLVTVSNFFPKIWECVLIFCKNSQKSNCKLNLKNGLCLRWWNTGPLFGQEELITQLWQKAIFKLCKIQCSVCNKYVTKKKEILVFFWFILKKIKTHYKIFGKKLETVTSETLKIKTQ